MSRHHDHDDDVQLPVEHLRMKAFRHGAFGPPMHGRGPWGGGPRARRGDIRAAVLRLLAEGPMHGYQIIQELSARSGGNWRPSPGSVYPTLQLLEDEGLVVSEESEGKRVYKLTDAGREQVESTSEAAAPWDELAEGSTGAVWQLRGAMGKLAAAAMQVGSSASEDQVTRVVEILNDARKKIYTILAED